MKARPNRRGYWILSWWQDCVLFVLSPLWVIPVLWLAQSRISPNGIGTVLAVIAAGHHLPGFIRAYTDPVLFRRFRLRFIFAPLFFLAAYLLFALMHLESLKLLLFCWGIWHGAMQVNGFLRIYDTKAGSVSALTSWLDWAMCIAWFGGVLLYSSRLIVFFSLYFKAGAAAVSPAHFAMIRAGWIAITAAITTAFLIHSLRQKRKGQAPSPVKYLMMASSFAVWWFAMLSVRSLLVGILMFEIVHDVQYCALVWFYNGRRVSDAMAASPVERFLFRPSLAKATAYIVIILIYGGIADVLGYLNIQAPSVLQAGVSSFSFWTGLYMVSTFLHFYFDGFIWQVREKNLQQGLGIQGSEAVQRSAAARGMNGAWKWAYFLIPAALLGYSEHRNIPVPEVEQASDIAALIPDSWEAQFVSGSMEKSAGHKEAALEHMERAVKLNPESASGELLLADIYEDRGDSERTAQHILRAVEIDPEAFDAQQRLAELLLTTGRVHDAIPHLERAILHKPDSANLNYLLGASLVEDRREVDGIPYLRRAIDLDPQHEQAYNFLGIALQDHGDLRAAQDYYRKALLLNPGDVQARENLKRAELLLQGAP